jgi:hypothetical protein
MFVPSLSWQNVRLYIYKLRKNGVVRRFFVGVMDEVRFYIYQNHHIYYNFHNDIRYYDQMTTMGIIFCVVVFFSCRLVVHFVPTRSGRSVALLIVTKADQLLRQA